MSIDLTPEQLSDLVEVCASILRTADRNAPLDGWLLLSAIREVVPIGWPDRYRCSCGVMVETEVAHEH